MRIGSSCGRAGGGTRLWNGGGARYVSLRVQYTFVQYSIYAATADLSLDEKGGKGESR